MMSYCMQQNHVKRKENYLSIITQSQRYDTDCSNIRGDYNRLRNIYNRSKDIEDKLKRDEAERIIKTYAKYNSTHTRSNKQRPYHGSHRRSTLKFPDFSLTKVRTK